MPVLFVGHGNPMNAILENEFTEGWRQMGKLLQPKAVLCVSAHWETRGTRVTMTPKPKTIHDFGGFPPALYKVQYPAPGAPQLASEVIEEVRSRSVQEDHEWGLDHGTWSVLVKMFPGATLPVFQLSLDYGMTLEEHYALAGELSFLRRRGVLIIGSGNIVHNLRMAQWENNEPYDWAMDFDEQVKSFILDHNHAALIEGGGLSREAGLSIPTPEHYLPLLYALAQQEDGESVSFFNEKVDMGSISMRSLLIS
ncbi:MAG: 4,5-DOPA-extradiol-dioxygenase [Bacteroidales bacterium]